MRFKRASASHRRCCSSPPPPHSIARRARIPRPKTIDSVFRTGTTAVLLEHRGAATGADARSAIFGRTRSRVLEDGAPREVEVVPADRGCAADAGLSTRARASCSPTRAPDHPRLVRLRSPGSEREEAGPQSAGRLPRGSRCQRAMGGGSGSTTGCTCCRTLTARPARLNPAVEAPRPRYRRRTRDPPGASRERERDTRVRQGWRPGGERQRAPDDSLGCRRQAVRETIQRMQALSTPSTPRSAARTFYP